MHNKKIFIKNIRIAFNTSNYETSKYKVEDIKKYKFNPNEIEVNNN